MRCRTSVASIRSVIQEVLTEAPTTHSKWEDLPIGSPEWTEFLKTHGRLTDADIDDTMAQLQNKEISTGSRVYWTGSLDDQEEPYESAARVGVVISADRKKYYRSLQPIELIVRVEELFPGRDLIQNWWLKSTQKIPDDLDWRPNETLPEDFYAL